MKIKKTGLSHFHALPTSVEMVDSVLPIFKFRQGKKKKIQRINNFLVV